MPVKHVSPRSTSTRSFGSDRVPDACQFNVIQARPALLLDGALSVCAFAPDGGGGRQPFLLFSSDVPVFNRFRANFRDVRCVAGSVWIPGPRGISMTIDCWVEQHGSMNPFHKEILSETTLDRYGPGKRVFGTTKTNGVPASGFLLSAYVPNQGLEINPGVPAAYEPVIEALCDGASVEGVPPSFLVGGAAASGRVEQVVLREEDYTVEMFRAGNQHRDSEGNLMYIVGLWAPESG